MAMKGETNLLPDNVSAPSESLQKFTQKPNRVFAWLSWLLIACHYLTWLKFLPGSFWLDECGTAWIAQGSLSEVPQRTLLLLHAPLFGAIATVAAAIGGINEVALRLPSWIAVGISIYVFSRVADELLEPDTARISLAIFTVWPIVSYSAADARPYSFALAALCGCYLFFLRALRSDQNREYAGFCLCAATLVHLHLLFVYVMVIPIAFLLVFNLPSAGLHRKKWLLSAISVLILLSPLAMHYRVMFTRGSSYSFSPIPAWSSLQSMLLPARPMLFFLISTVLCAGFILRIKLNFSQRD